MLPGKHGAAGPAVRYRLTVSPQDFTVSLWDWTFRSKVKYEARLLAVLLLSDLSSSTSPWRKQLAGLMAGKRQVFCFCLHSSLE